MSKLLDKIVREQSKRILAEFAKRAIRNREMMARVMKGGRLLPHPFTELNAVKEKTE